MVYARSVAGPTVVELARAAVRRLAEAAPAANTARAALEEIERIGLGPPYTIAVAGDLIARTELLNQLAGEPLFDAARRDPERIVMSMRRGAATMLKARRRNGKVEQQTLEDAEPGDPITGEPDDAEATTPRAPALAEETEATKVREPRAPQHPPENNESGVLLVPPSGAQSAPAVVAVSAERTVPVRRPPWWAVWEWVMLWLQAWRLRKRGLPASAPQPASPPAPAPVVRESPRRSTIREEDARTTVVPRKAREPARPKVDPRVQFTAALRAVLADEEVERLFIEVDRGPLPDKVIVVELPTGAPAKSLAAIAADVCLVACGSDGFVGNRQLKDVLNIVPHLFALGATSVPAGAESHVRLVSSDAIVDRLTEVATIERSLAVGKRAIAVLMAGCTVIEDAIAAVEIGFRSRIDRLVARRIPDAGAYTSAQLAQLRPRIADVARQLVIKAQASLDARIDQLAAEWTARLGNAASTDELRKTAARIDGESPALIQSAHAAAQLAVIDGLTERAHALYRELASALGQRGAPVDAPPPWLTVELPVTEQTWATSLGSVAPRLTSLFRSLDTLKTEAVSQLEQRVTALHQLAEATWRDTEPRLEPALSAPLAIALRADVERHSSWLEAELARERIAIDAERAELTLFSLARDTANADARELSAALDELAEALP